MNWRHGPLPDSSSLRLSPSDDIVSAIDPAYSNTSSDAAPHHFQAVDVELVISSCDMEPPVSHLRQYPSAEHYNANWPGQFMLSTLPFGCSLNTNHFSPTTFHEPYSNSDASTSPLSYCGPQTMSASSSCGSAFDFGPSQGVINTHSRNFWPNTPGSDDDIRVKQEPDTDYQSIVAYQRCSHPTPVPTFAPIGQLGTNDFSLEFERFEVNNTSAPAAVDNDGEHNILTEPLVAPIEVTSASRLQCTICGARFTRRSNCREHMKRHDPNARKSYPCEHCGKNLGRKTDLKRHIESVHRGIRKFGCGQCGHYFSRQDTLARHMADGCRRRGRKSINYKEEVELLTPSTEGAIPKGN